MPHPDPIEPLDAAELRRELAAAPDEHACDTSAVDMTRDEALLRLADLLPDEAFASVHLVEVALTNRDVADRIRSGRPARFHREWTVLITAPGYSHNHAGDQLGPVVEQALADYLDWRAARDAQEWARTAVPDTFPEPTPPAAAAPASEKPPKLAAPGTAERRQDERDKDAG